MGGRQKTFTLLEPPGPRPTGPIAPMTSRQAKKNYQKANRGPRMSVAERRKQEAAELARQKKEHEKEINAAKAKAAREKKAAKEKAERETRRKMGLPEPSKWVRASQPTISRFARCGTKRTWEELDDIMEESDITLQCSPTKKVTTDKESDDEFGEFPSLSQSDIFEELDSSIASINEEQILPKDAMRKQNKSIPQSQDPSSLRLQQKRKCIKTRSSSKPSTIPTRPPHLSKELSDTEYGEFPSLTQCDILERLVSSASPPIDTNNLAPKSDALDPGTSIRGLLNNEKELAPNLQANPSHEFPLDNSQEVAHMAATQLLTEAADALSRITRSESSPIMSPPQPKFSHSASSPKKTALANVRSRDEKRQKLKAADANQSTQPVLVERSANMPPPPVPLRVAKSITPAASHNKSMPTLPANIIDVTLPASNIPPSSTQAFLENHFDDFFPSPSQQLRELMDDINEIPSNTQVAKEIDPIRPSVGDAFADLLSTQDIQLSAEDLLEITTPSRTPPYQKGRVAFTQPGTDCILEAEPNMAAPREKRRFFEEKDEDLLHAAIQESKKVVNRPRSMREDADSNTGNCTAALRQKARFFEEKEEDLYHAALHDSKMLTTARKKQEPSRRSTRTLHRVLSNASDYGFDEFTGCSQELLALP